jgi:UBX domain-containing protein 1
VDDGELYDINDPQNAHILQMIRSGRAPLDIMNVSRDQEVDVKVEQHDGPYEAPQKKSNPFSGAGQRLGSPTPGVVTSTAATSGASSSSVPVASGAGAGGSSAAAVTLDESQPTISIQVRLGDGTRLVSRFNPSHTIGDLYAFVDRSSAESAARPYALMTTFPSKDLSERAMTLGDTAELKKGGGVVQKWL